MMTLAEIDAAERAAMSRLRERRGISSKVYEAERRSIHFHFAGERDRLIRSMPAGRSRSHGADCRATTGR